ncbi:MAG: hypothetical protein P8P83_01370 [Rickettsiaceae bacterium]|nr:hypothetical protein [Rickettsiaceae bacterium]
MKLSRNELEIVNNNESQFISFKYLGDDGLLKQIDCSAKSLEENFPFANLKEISLQTIENKNFVDPFRSFSTTTFFCENLSSKHNSRQRLTALLSNNKELKNLESIDFATEISFWIDGQSSSIDQKFTTDPVDKFANLRSDIVATLERVNIKTGLHFHGKNSGESVITIQGNSIVDLSDNLLISKFIIANVADSYGFHAEFTPPNNDTSNIALLVKGTDHNIENISALIERNLNNTHLLRKNNTSPPFNLNKTCLYRGLSSSSAYKIELTCGDLSDLYLVFIDLLSHSEAK